MKGALKLVQQSKSNYIQHLIIFTRYSVYCYLVLVMLYGVLGDFQNVFQSFHVDCID